MDNSLAIVIGIISLMILFLIGRFITLGIIKIDKEGLKNYFKFNFNSEKDENSPTNEREFTFIWWKEMKVNDKKIYTKPFRTTVKAKNYKEAKEKIENFALKKMKLNYTIEKDYEKTKSKKDFQNAQKEFEKFNKMMKDMFGGEN